MKKALSVLIAFCTLFSFIFIAPDSVITASADSISLHVWVSAEGMGEEAKYFLAGDWCYLCYELLDSNGNRIQGYEDYKITMTIKNPDGTNRYTDYYSNSNNNWIAAVMDTPGYFDCNVSVSGNIVVECDVSGRVIPRTVDAYTWLSNTGEGMWGERDTDTEIFTIGETIYFWYKITNPGSQELCPECVNIQATEELIFPDGTSWSYTYDNNNNWIRSTLDQVGTWTFVLDVKGDYSGTITKSFVVTDNKEFKYQRDNWSFTNSGNYFTHSFYYLQDSDRTQLMRGLTFIEQARILSDSLKNWEGSCYGMTALAILNKSGTINANELPGKPAALYNADNPNQNYSIESAINYYHLLQDTNVIKQTYANQSKFAQRIKLDTIITLAKSNKIRENPVMVCYSGKFNGTTDAGHSVMLYGCESGTYSFNNSVYDLKILVYDPNSIVHDNSKCLYINQSTHTWCVPSYQLGDNWNNGKLTSVISDYNILNYHGLYGNQNTSIAAQDFYAILSSAAYNGLPSIGKLSEDSSTLYTFSADDEIEIFYDVFGDSTTPSVMNAVLPDLYSKYVYSTKESEKYDLQMSYENIYYSVEADNGKRTIFSPEGECIVTGSGGTCIIEEVVNQGEKCPVKWSNIRVENKETSMMSLNNMDQYYLLQSDSLNDCKVSSITSFESGNTIFRILKSNGSRAIIYDENDKLIVRVYGDLNNDDMITISDVIILQKWLLGESSVKIPYWKTADMNDDGKLNAIDLTMLKRELCTTLPF